MGNRILLIGGGGNCRSIIDILLENDVYDLIGIVDNQIIDMSSLSKKIVYVGTDEDLESLYKSGWNNAFVSLGSIGDSSIRKHLYCIVKKIGFCVPNIISKSAVLSKHCLLGDGIFVGKNAILNINVHIGDCCIINTGSIVEHDCVVGAFSHISPGAILCGGVSVGSDSHIGAGCVIKQGLTIGDNTLVGMGSIVTHDLDADSLYYGNPCHFVKRR